MASRYASSLSLVSTHAQKKRPAYRRYMIFDMLRNSTKLDWCFWSRGAMRRWTWAAVSNEREVHWDVYRRLVCVRVRCAARWQEKGVKYLALKLDLFFILCHVSIASCHQCLTCQPTLYGAYHFANRVFPLSSADCQPGAILHKDSFNILSVLNQNE